MDEFGNAQAAMKMDGFFSNTLAKSDPEVAAAIGDQRIPPCSHVAPNAQRSRWSTATTTTLRW